MDWLTTIFGRTNDISALQECARAVVVFAYGLALVRLLGRRVFGRWAALDIIVSIVAGSNLSRALTGGAPLFGTLAATTVLMLLHWLFAHAAARSALVSRVVEGRPATLAEDGRLDTDRLRRFGVSEADLNEALRQAGVTEIGQTRLVTLEPSGKIGVIRTR
ncbi:DUF421 domain-containing protein [Alsobacter sp. SYSU M60028]|uniref:DUF421 domain-containing protein n=1 Tax=Alsobacter ponti TaxID=2962936 RepID=A0ABT1LHD6_9HYPH|nr:YetF domain-containing protein [Alsobacter ponti]MCP8940915.1 DUF421 domain-containing protein [Alsobacter ponti]